MAHASSSLEEQQTLRRLLQWDPGHNRLWTPLPAGEGYGPDNSNTRRRWKYFKATVKKNTHGYVMKSKDPRYQKLQRFYTWFMLLEQNGANQIKKAPKALKHALPRTLTTDPIAEEEMICQIIVNPDKGGNRVDDVPESLHEVRYYYFKPSVLPQRTWEHPDQINVVTYFEPMAPRLLDSTYGGNGTGFITQQRPSVTPVQVRDRETSVLATSLNSQVLDVDLDQRPYDQIVSPANDDGGVEHLPVALLYFSYDYGGLRFRGPEILPTFIRWRPGFEFDSPSGSMIHEYIESRVAYPCPEEYCFVENDPA